MAWTNLRQVAVVTSDLEAAVAELASVFRLRIAYNDPGVEMFGLRNALLPVGTQFIEVLTPLRAGTAAGRQLERAGGDSGYMVICHTDDHERRRQRVEELGVRIAFEAVDHGYRIMQLHPADTGGSFLEVDYQPGGEDPTGPWGPAGPSWQDAVCTDVVDGISSVTVASRHPDETAARWAAILEVALDARPEDGPVLALDNAKIHFAEGPVDSLVGVTFTGPAAVPEATVAGVRFAGVR